MNMNLDELKACGAFDDGLLIDGVIRYRVVEGKKVTLIMNTDADQGKKSRLFWRGTVDSYLEMYGLEVFFQNDILYYRVDCGWYKTTRYATDSINILVENLDFKPNQNL